ncbi:MULTISPECIES: MarR family transcriptional regulator [unclassified Paenibacillus]|uniref:MarR family winged helix-turn-helix transcriptional regulator n=1 Tax=unclassified Paenibacillus TaxID=185978 RepID=UPI00240547E5|nr:MULTISPECIES: MarR family transcriptional regulator [unclassified Paenibacillus]MDF9839876.1 DNA-binding MarR family transcriptional regulator [Paenibacillus sp. PastF-2]MDF9846457.1 DNA-binding MarR family transcriptional regulator [Paenibacillus sp. PastM-2]MDF9853194.1 DNA-binding MarR family transcriptional regulator [Paenibacillus sp. PastF-1]MDH6478302.1 DNA-binding MarR family transcriptional regulator [Paenibacillus sp. PastH-2]MDH6506200.1 DNA-binding MarR family transcriptional re
MDNNLLFQQIVAFTAAVHQVTSDLTKDVKSGVLTPVQYKILEYIAVSQPVTLSEISDCMNMSMPNTSRELKKLTEKQLCSRVTDPADRRRQGITLSPSGEAMMGEAFQTIGRRFEERIAHLSEEERREIGQALGLLQQTVFY